MIFLRSVNLPRPRKAAALGFAVCFFTAQRALAAGDWFSKPLRYQVLDTLILSSPFTGLISLVCMTDPRWRERPGRWRTSRYVPSNVRRWLTWHFVLIATTGTLSMLGAATLAAHLAGRI
jgi:hypothetical protein